MVAVTISYKNKKLPYKRIEIEIETNPFTLQRL